MTEALWRVNFLVLNEIPEYESFGLFIYNYLRADTHSFILKHRLEINFIRKTRIVMIEN